MIYILTMMKSGPLMAKQAALISPGPLYMKLDMHWDCDILMKQTLLCGLGSQDINLTRD